MTKTNRTRRAAANRSSRSLGTAVLVGALALGSTACKDFLDVNKNPNAPETTEAINYLAPMMHWVATSEQYDGRYVGRYAQEWVLPSSTPGNLASSWDLHGYAPGSDAAAQLYRDVYWNLGINLALFVRRRARAADEAFGAAQGRGHKSAED